MTLEGCLKPQGLGHRVVEASGKGTVTSFLREGTRVILIWNQRVSQGFSNQEPEAAQDSVLSRF